jgi:hypothetical protein
MAWRETQENGTLRAGTGRAFASPAAAAPRFAMARRGRLPNCLELLPEISVDVEQHVRRV